MHGGYLCVIYLTNGQRFQGAVTHTQEAAAESAASIALHHLVRWQSLEVLKIRGKNMKNFGHL